jgi:sigma-B regulation protein RsbU (phosphoserine phosphatase)
MIIRSAEREAENAARAWINEVEEVLRSLEESTGLLGDALGRLDLSDDDLGRLLRAFVAGNTKIYGSTAALVPYGFSSSIERFSPYYHRVSEEEIVFADLADDAYRYWEWDWYTEVVESGEPRWSEPYYDEGGGNIPMVTYSVPVFRETGGERDLIGVVTADLALGWLSELVRSIRIGRTGYGVIISGSGQLIAHSDETVTEMRQRNAEPEVEEIVRRMLQGESGFRVFEDQVLGKRTRLTYAPIGTAGWSLAVVYPEDELMEDVDSLFAKQIALLILGLGILVGVVVFLSRHLTRPIKALASSAGRIATGDLDTDLPIVSSHDEVGTLARAFHHMRDSLKNYIRDLQITTAAKERLESELEIARKIQMDMLPEGEIGGGEDDGFELSAKLVPARQVGGDLYYHFMADGRLYFIVGDVSGKGVPAALFMARTKTLFETISVRENDVGAALTEVNRNLCKENDAGMFVTVVAGVLDLASGELACAAGGHDPPALIPGSGEPPRFVEIDGGAVLGLLDLGDFPTNHYTLEPGDTVVLYTDGVPEALNEKEDFFTGERLLEVLSRLGPSGAAQISVTVMTAVKDFAGNARQSDDITVMAIRYTPSNKSES